jgi:hypothetical protein
MSHMVWAIHNLTVGPPVPGFVLRDIHGPKVLLVAQRCTGETERKSVKSDQADLDMLVQTEGCPLSSESSGRLSPFLGGAT